MGILREMTPAERPREKLQTLGAGALTDVELIAILLRTGYAGHSVLEVARAVYYELLRIRESDTRAFETQNPAYQRLHWQDLNGVAGVGPDKAVTLCAAIELGRRIGSHHGKMDKPNFSDPETVAKYFMPHLKDLEEEELHCCYLNAKNRLLREVKVSGGGVESSIADVRVILREAIRWKAVGMILVHNHPSGDPTPSRADLALTRRLYEAGELLTIRLLDHVVIGDGQFISMRRGGMLQH